MSSRFGELTAWLLDQDGACNPCHATQTKFVSVENVTLHYYACYIKHIFHPPHSPEQCCVLVQSLKELFAINLQAEVNNIPADVHLYWYTAERGVMFCTLICSANTVWQVVYHMCRCQVKHDNHSHCLLLISLLYMQVTYTVLLLLQLYAVLMLQCCVPGLLV